MSLFQQEVKKRIGPYMKAKGFRLRGRTYYFIENDVAYCVTFEQPSGLMYAWVHVNPLYIPDESLFLSYGNRLSNIADIKLPVLTKWSDSADIDNWCKLFCSCMDTHILPFFRQTDTPIKLLAYVERPGRKGVDGMIGGSPLSVAKLSMYTYMYLNNWPKAEEAIGAFRKALLDGRITVSLREQLQKEADETELLISKGEEAVNAFCSQTISNARRLFIYSTPP